jgi:hypothetical protein
LSTRAQTLCGSPLYRRTWRGSSRAALLRTVTPEVARLVTSIGALCYTNVSFPLHFRAAQDLVMRSSSRRPAPRAVPRCRAGRRVACPYADDGLPRASTEGHAMRAQVAVNEWRTCNTSVVRCAPTAIPFWHAGSTNSLAPDVLRRPSSRLCCRALERPLRRGAKYGY